jgi:peptidoglycan/LPS O-acetylase OafA/YrhL
MTLARAEAGSGSAAPASAQAPSRPRFEALDGLRGVAALGVLAIHTGASLHLDFIARHGYLAVDFFFVISGFVIASAYEARLVAGGWRLGFIRARVVRLWPLLVIGTAIGFLVWRAPDQSWLTLALLLLAGLFLIPTSSHNSLYQFDPPAWSLLYEVVVNLAYAGLIRFVTTRRLILLAAAAGVVHAAFTIYSGRGDRGPIPHEWPFAVVRAVFSFSMGLLIYRLRPRIRIPVLPATAVLAAIFFIPPWHGASWISDLAAVFIAFPLIVAGAVNADGGPVSRISGRLSYPLYVTHLSVLPLFRPHLVDRPRTDPVLWAGFALELATALALAFAALKTDDWLHRRVPFLRRSVGGGTAPGARRAFD